MRSDWTTLPDAVTAAIADRIGGLTGVTPAPAGDHAEIAATVAGRDATVFIKAASADLGVRSLRYELGATAAVDRWSPAVLWQFEAGGWLVGAFEHLDGPHADLSPGSRDLDTLAATLKGLQETPAPAGTWFAPADRLGWEHPAMAGDMLVHSDLNPANLIVTPDGLRVVDWAWVTKAASWVELALLVQWLVGSGHSPAEAEQWLAQFAAWPAVEPVVLDDFAARSAAKWSAKTEPGSAGWVSDLATWNTAWAAHRAAHL